MSGRSTGDRLALLLGILVVLLGTAGAAAALLLSVDIGGDDEEPGAKQPVRTTPELAATGREVRRLGVVLRLPAGWTDITADTLTKERRQRFPDTRPGPGVDPDTVVVLARGGTPDDPDWTVRLWKGSTQLSAGMQRLQDQWTRERHCTRPSASTSNVRPLPATRLGGQPARVCEDHTAYPRDGQTIERTLDATAGGYAYRLIAETGRSRPAIERPAWNEAVRAFEALRTSVTFERGASAPPPAPRRILNRDVAVAIPSGWIDRTASSPSAMSGGRLLAALGVPSDPLGRAIVIGRSAKRSTRPSQQPQILTAFRRYHGRICRDPRSWGNSRPQSGTARSKGVTRLGGRAAVHCAARVRNSGRSMRVEKVATVRDGYDVSIVALWSKDAEGRPTRSALERVRRSLRFR